MNKKIPPAPEWASVFGLDPDDGLVAISVLVRMKNATYDISGVVVIPTNGDSLLFTLSDDNWNLTSMDDVEKMRPARSV